MMNARFVLLVLLASVAAGAVPGAAVEEQAPGASPAPANAMASPAAPPAPSNPTELEHLLAAIERDERVLRAEVESAKRGIEQAKQRSLAFGRAYVRSSRAGLLPVAGGFDSFVDHASRLERLRRALDRELVEERALGRHRLALEKKLSEVQARGDELRVQQRTLAEAHTALLAAADRALAFQRAFSSSMGPRHTAVYGSAAGPVEPGDLERGFVGMKGRLPFPVPGRAEVSAARKESATSAGIEFQVPGGTPVRAVFPGRIAFADQYADYGRTVIIDHGAQYFTVSADLAGFSVRAGDDVVAGTRIGTTGGQTGSAPLYLEIRHAAESLDPSAWFGI